MGKQKVTLTLSDEALEVIVAQASERKRGEWVSDCVLGWKARQDALAANAGGILERIDGRLARLESSVESLLVK